MNETERRLKRETLIAHKVVRCLLAAGYSISVNDGEETVLRRSTDATAIFAVMQSTDEDYLLAYRNGKHIGTVMLIYGNDTDIIADYHTSLQNAVQPALDYANSL